MGKWSLTGAIVKLFERATGLNQIFMRNPQETPPPPVAMITIVKPPAKPLTHSIPTRELFIAFQKFIVLRDAQTSPNSPLTNAIMDVIEGLSDFSYPDNTYEGSKLLFLRQALFDLHALSPDIGAASYIDVQTTTLEKLHTGLFAIDAIVKDSEKHNRNTELSSKLSVLSYSFKSMLVSRQIDLAKISGEGFTAPVFEASEKTSAEIIPFDR